MPNIVELYNLRPGDKVVLPIFRTGLSKHHVIYWDRDIFGRDWFVENRIFIGVHFIESEELFKDDTSIDRVVRFEGGQNQREMAKKRALSLVGKKYNLLTYNCEHFANEVQTGIASSEQVGIAALFSLGALALYLTTSKE